MKISKVLVSRGRKLHLENYDNEKFEIQLEAEVDERDEPQDVIQGLKGLLDRHLDAWEKTVRGETEHQEEIPPVVIKTASELVEDAIFSKTNVKEKPQQGSTKNTEEEEEEQSLICPKCNEPMVKKEGKDYFLCTKHWGYPDMIKKGQVREKKF